MQTEQARVATPVSDRLIGRDAGAFGRIFRLVGGLGLTLVGALQVDRAGLLPVGVFVLALVVFYTVLHWLLGRRRLARLDPFVATVVALGPLGVFSLSAFPDALHSAIGLYVGMSLVLNAVIGYGGCEVVALPTLVFRRRHVVYCPANIIDAAEWPLRRTDDLIGRAAAVGALVVVGYFFVIRQLLLELHAPDPIPERWSLLLLAPAALLLYRAWTARTSGRAAVWSPLLGAAALTGLALVIAGVIGWDMLFGGAVLAGLLTSLARATFARRRIQDSA